MSLLSRVSRFAARHDLWRPGARVVAAVSGGSDSVAMLHLLHDLHARGALHLDAVAHLNHAIRDDAQLDADFCRDLASRLGVAFESRTVDVPALARRRRQSIELAARLERRAFLEEVRQRRQAEAVASAHTRDDQAETVLLRLMRGAGVRGLGGIAPRAGAVVRPVLWATRAELRRLLEGRREPWREDATNADLTHPRNRVRHELLPYLERHFNPSVRAALVRLAELARDDEAHLAREAAAAAVALSAPTSRTGDVALDRRALTTLPAPLARRVLRHVWPVGPRVPAPGWDAIDAARRAAAAERRVELPGVTVEPLGEPSRGSVVLVPRRASPAAYCVELPVPGRVRLEELGWMVDAEGPRPADPDSQGRVDGSGWTIRVDADEVGRVLLVRNRRPGDRLAPLGLGGHKKVQDILVDRKVARPQRDAVPIVTTGDGRLIWVAGHVMSDDFRVTARTTGVITLNLRRI